VRETWAVAPSPDHAADAEHPVVIDVDATLVTAHSDKELARRRSRRALGSTRC